MSSPCIEVDLHKIRHNTRTLVDRLKARGIRVTGVTKAVCGHPTIASAMIDGGVAGLAEARLSNVQILRRAGISCPVTLIRTPMLSQADDVVQVCEASYNTQLAVITALAAAAIRQNKVHDIILMVEMGDQREGIMPKDLGGIAQQVMEISGVALKGIGANFACLGDVAPTAAKMKTLSDLANGVEGLCGPVVQTVSGGNSANLPWALGQNATGRINDLRLGEAILLGVDPVTGNPIEGMFRDAFTLVAEIIERSSKSFSPHNNFADPTLARLRLMADTKSRTHTILAIGQQDTDIGGLALPAGNTFIGATSDHLILETAHAKLRVGSEMRFQMNYSALMRAMAAPDIQTNLLQNRPAPDVQGSKGPSKHLALV